MCDDYWFPEKSVKRDEHSILCLDQCSTFPAQVPPTAIISCPRSELSPILLPHICYHYSIFFLSLALTIAWGTSLILCPWPCHRLYAGRLAVAPYPTMCFCFGAEVCLRCRSCAFAKLCVLPWAHRLNSSFPCSNCY